MGNMVPLKTGKGTAREQLLELAAHQDRAQGKSLVQHPRDLLARVERTGGGAVPQLVSLRALRETYTYLLGQQERVAAQIEVSREVAKIKTERVRGGR